MSEPSAQPQRFLGISDCTVRISAHPRGKSREVQAAGAGVWPAVNRCGGVMPLRIVLRKPLLDVELCAVEVATAVEDRPQRVVGLEKKHGISTLAGHAEQLLPETSCLAIQPP